MVVMRVETVDGTIASMHDDGTFGIECKALIVDPVSGKMSLDFGGGLVREILRVKRIRRIVKGAV